MLFESKHSLDEKEFSLSKGHAMTFPIHIHRSFEYFEQVEGSTEVVVGNNSYLLSAGDAVLTFPLQPHSYKCLERGKYTLCIFSPDIVADFYKKNENRIPNESKFICNIPSVFSADNIYHQKSLAYFILGNFDDCRQYVRASEKSEDKLLVSLLLYADRNFRTPFILRDAASAIGYDYAYVSKFFKRKVGISFKQYLNNLRVTEGKTLLSTSEKSIEEIGEECGFSSLRTFDREFRLHSGVTPSEYRKKHKKADS